MNHRFLTITLQPDWQAGLRASAVVALAGLGLLERTDAGGVVCPFESLHIDIHLKEA